MTSPLVSGPALMDPSQAGGKAAALARAAAWFKVPDFFVIAPDAFAEDGLTLEHREPLLKAIEALGTGPFAVRSSGLEEDGARAAHAGQFLSVLNVRADQVIETAYRVWRSGFSDSLRAYRLAHGLDGSPQPPAVIVQRMARARAAGVAFSACPVSGDRGIAVISAVNGLADRLVAGEVDGDTYRIDRAGATTSAERADDARPVLTEHERAAVAALSRSAEDRFGAPQDVEWVFEDDTLLLLQSRPITRIMASPDEGLAIWDNSNIVESYPGLVSPLTFSFARYVYAHAYRAFAALMGVSNAKVAENHVVFANMLGRADGRVYYNLLNWYRALALFPGFKANRAFMEQMMGVAEALPPDIALRIAPDAASPWERLIDQARFLRVGAGLVWHGFRLPKTIRKFMRRFDEALARSDKEIETLSATALVDEYRSLELRLLERWDAPLINDFLCMAAFGVSRRALEKWAGPEGVALHSDAMIGQGDIVSAEPAQRIRQMGALVRDDTNAVAALERGDIGGMNRNTALAAAFENYLNKFGDRCTEELKLESLPLRDDPQALILAIAAAARRERVEPQPSVDVDVRLTALLRGRPLQRNLARWLLAWARARVRDRENLRFERTRLFGRVRRIFRTLGARLTEAGILDDPRDIFFLTLEEALGAVEGGGVSADLRGLARVRAEEARRDAERPDPPERFTTHGAVLTSPRTAKTSVETNRSAERRGGLACCAGVVEGRVRVIADPRLEALEAGEILVARHTDPGWIAVFANAIGVIAERGSLLSHSAIVAREMGVPCVVGVKGATEWLKTGDRVRLDGGAGLVERLADE